VPVHLLNELVKQTPEGIYITSVKQDNQNLNVSGIAQTQERISEFPSKHGLQLRVAGPSRTDREQGRFGADRQSGTEAPV
jgi:hypothetical protein